mmetsp:Transcript_23187/g.67616  ORF Transcript_23187/g.67616 Transcript_23187/m.67616 type:complete len:418 (-) Transcript_23187:331-1584(-)
MVRLAGRQHEDFLNSGALFPGRGCCVYSVRHLQEELWLLMQFLQEFAIDFSLVVRHAGLHRISRVIGPVVDLLGQGDLVLVHQQGFLLLLPGLRFEELLLVPLGLFREGLILLLFPLHAEFLGLDELPVGLRHEPLLILDSLLVPPLPFQVRLFLAEGLAQDLLLQLLFELELLLACTLLGPLLATGLESFHASLEGVCPLYLFALQLGLVCLHEALVFESLLLFPLHPDLPFLEVVQLDLAHALSLSVFGGLDLALLGDDLLLAALKHPFVLLTACPELFLRPALLLTNLDLSNALLLRHLAVPDLLFFFLALLPLLLPLLDFGKVRNLVVLIMHLSSLYKMHLRVQVPLELELAVLGRLQLLLGIRFVLHLLAGLEKRPLVDALHQTIHQGRVHLRPSPARLGRAWKTAPCCRRT